MGSLRKRIDRLAAKKGSDTGDTILIARRLPDGRYEWNGRVYTEAELQDALRDMSGGPLLVLDGYAA